MQDQNFSYALNESKRQKKSKLPYTKFQFMSIIENHKTSDPNLAVKRQMSKDDKKKQQLEKQLIEEQMIKNMDQQVVLSNLMGKSMKLAEKSPPKNFSP